MSRYWSLVMLAFFMPLECSQNNQIPLVSILAPLVGDLKAVKDFLQDISLQTIRRECELILLSSEADAFECDLLDDFRANFLSIRHEHVNQAGLFEMLNYGIKKSSGKYICHTQVHDRRSPASLEHQVAALEADATIDLVYSDYRWQADMNIAYGERQADWIVKAWQFSPASMYKCLPGPHALWRRSLHKKYGLFEPSFKYCGDWELWLRAVGKGARFKKIDGISGVHSPKTMQLNDQEEAIKKAENAFIAATYAHVWQVPFASRAELPFVFVVPSYNNNLWCEKNLASLLAQKYENFKIIYCDDCSTDGMSERLLTYLAQHPRAYKVEYIKNNKRVGALENIYKAVWSCRPTDIIVLVDGDDWCAHSLVLSHLNAVYHDPSVWITYGQFQRTDGQHYRSSEVPLEWIKNQQIRQYPWTASHLRTFYAGLFQRIKKEDLLYNNGAFFPMGWDLAMMYPMIEMAQEHSRFIPHLLYMYNTENPINDHKVNYPLQYACDQFIRAKRIYEKLDHLF